MPGLVFTQRGRSNSRSDFSLPIRTHSYEREGRKTGQGVENVRASDFLIYSAFLISSDSRGWHTWLTIRWASRVPKCHSRSISTTYQRTDLNFVSCFFFSTFFRPVVCELTGRDLPFRIALMMSDGTKGEARTVREEKYNQVNFDMLTWFFCN